MEDGGSSAKAEVGRKPRREVIIAGKLSRKGANAEAELENAVFTFLWSE